MLKKMTVLAMAAGIVAALALPTSASAAWKHHNTPLVQDAQLGLTGQARFQGGLGGVECQITSRTKFLASQTTATAETFVPHPGTDTQNCKGLGGLAFCQIHNLTPQNPHWIAHTLAAQAAQPQTAAHPDRVTVTTTTIHSQATGGFCPIKTISLTPGSVTLIPQKTRQPPHHFVNDPNTVETAVLSASLEAHFQTNNGVQHTETVIISGHLTIEAPNSNTYSI